MPSPWDSRLASTFGVRRAQVDKAATWAADAVDAVVRRHWARLTALARGGGPFNHVYTLSREIIVQMQTEVLTTVTQRLYGAADWSYSTAVDALLNALPTEAYRWIVAERLFGAPQLQEQIAWPPKLTKAQRRNLEFEAIAIGFRTVEEYLDSLLRLLPSDMAEDERRSALAGLIRDSHGKLPPDRVTSFQRPGKQATIVLGRPDSLSKWWAAGFHKLPRAQQQDVLRQFVFEPPTKEQIKRIVEKPSSFGGKPPMGYHDRLEMLSHIIADKDQLARRFAASVSNGDMPRDTMLAILPQVNNYKVSAQRIARTELARVAQGMAQEMYDDCADVIEGQQMHAIMDVVTRPDHAARNGHIWYIHGSPPIEEMPVPPYAWNCRCYTSPVLKTPESVRNNPELLKQYKDNAGPIQDPLVYSQWWDRASDEERRAVVGSRRYDAVAQKIAGVGKPKFEDFVDPQSGELIKTDQLRAEDLAAFADRRQKNAEAFQTRAALLRQTAEKSFLDVPTKGDNPPPPKPVKPPPAPKPPAEPKVKPIKPKAKKRAASAKEQYEVPDAERKAIGFAVGIVDKLKAFTTGDKIVAAIIKAGDRTELDKSQAAFRDATAAWKQLDDDWHLLQDEIRNARGAKRKELLAKQDEMRPKLQELSRRRGELSAAGVDIIEARRQRIAAALAAPVASRKGVDVAVDNQFSADDREKFARVKKWLDDIVATDGPNGKLAVEANQLPLDKRPYHEPGKIFIAERGLAKDIAHEIGHELNERPDVRDAAKRFLTHRMNGDTATYPMGDTAGSPGKWPGETTRGVDDFEKLYLAQGLDASTAKYYAAYTGRHYGQQSEIVSMGIEALYRDAHAFATADPEYFKFIIGVLRGVFQ